MKTEQAHSREGTRFRASVDIGKHVPPAIWPNLVCLDAPLVAIVWLWLFARTFRVPLQLGNAVALFLTAWLIYLADRLADSLLLKPGTPRSARHAFCLRHREVWIVTVALVAGFDSYVIWRTTATQTFLVGAVVGLLAMIYLVLNHPFGRIWRWLPAKELAIGILFCAGTMVALQPDLPLSPAFVTAVVCFAVLCALNCVSIANWERHLDEAQQKVSIATRHPGVARHSGIVCAILAFAAFAAAIGFRYVAPVFACVAASAILLVWLNQSRSFLQVDERTALADLVLLTPFLVLLPTML
jgi:hypothetical protein